MGLVNRETRIGLLRLALQVRGLSRDEHVVGTYVRGEKKHCAVVGYRTIGGRAHRSG